MFERAKHRLDGLTTREAPTLEAAGRIAADALAVLLSAYLAFGLISVFHAFFSDEAFVSLPRLVAERASPFVSVTCVVCLYFLFKGHYHMRIPFWDEAKGATTAAGLALLAEGFLLYAARSDVSRSHMVLTWALMPFVVMWSRYFWRGIKRSMGQGAVRAVVFGKPADAARASDLLRSDGHLGIDVVSVADIVSGEAAAAMMAERRATDAVVALSFDDAREMTLVSDLRRRGYSICVIPPAMGLSASMDVQYILGRDAMMLVSRPEVTPRLSRAAKRLFDTVVATTLLLVLSVPMAAIAVAIASDGGSPFFSHRRIGKGGKAFGCLKFRSMRVDAEQRLEEYLEVDPAAREAWEKTRKLPDDPRITKIGKFIRRTSLDELPQLVNVLTGKMSLVGPRPVTEQELAHYAGALDLYTAVKPGMTGLWQVSGRSDLSYERRVALDTWYVSNWSPWHDIAILSKTVPVVLGRGGAY